MERLRGWARRIRRDALTVWLLARDPRTPWFVKLLALCVAGYAFSPIDLIPDFVPVLGYLDDLLLLPLGILAVIRLTPAGLLAEHRARAAVLAERPVSRRAALLIAVVWIAAIALTSWMAWRRFG